MADLNAVYQRIVVFMTTLDWACGSHVVDDFWTPAAAQVASKTLKRLVWQKFGGKSQC